MKRFFLLLAAAATLSVSAHAAPQIKIPPCPAIEGWAARVNPNEGFAVAPRLSLPNAFADAQLVPVFGVPATAWTNEDVQAAGQAMVACYGEAGKRRDKPAADALAVANRTLAGTLPRINPALQRAKTDADAARTALSALPNSVDLDHALEVLLAMNPATPDGNPLRGLPREVFDPAWRLATTLPNLANGEREASMKALGERRTQMAGAFAGDAESAIASAGNDAAGALQLMQTRVRLAGLSDAATRARLDKSAADKLQQIRDGLRAAKPAAWVPPDCTDLYRWSGAPQAFTVVPVGNRNIYQAFLDERVVPVFGLSIADWSDEDVARMKALRAFCHTAWQTPLPPGAPPSELQQLARAGQWIDGADQPISEARLGIGAQRKTQQAVSAVLEKIQGMPDTMDSLPQLMQIANDPNLATTSQEDRTRIVNAINAKRTAIATQAADAATKGLADVKPASLGDLGKLTAYIVKAVQTIPDQRAQQNFVAAGTRSLDEAAQRLMPDFQAKLAAMPADFDGMAQARTAVAKLTGIPDAQRIPALQSYQAASKARIDTISKTLRDQACGDLLSNLGASGDAKLALWNGNEETTLGDYLCGFAEHGTEVNSYAGAGMFSSTYTLKVTPIKEAMQTVLMRKAEVKQGKQMLVGYDIQLPNLPPEAKTQGVGQMNSQTADIMWFSFSEQATKDGLYTEEACLAMNGSADKLGPQQKLFWLHCLTFPKVQAKLN